MYWAPVHHVRLRGRAVGADSVPVAGGEASQAAGWTRHRRAGYQRRRAGVRQTEASRHRQTEAARPCRLTCVIPYDMWVPVTAWQLSELLYSCYFTYFAHVRDRNHDSGRSPLTSLVTRDRQRHHEPTSTDSGVQSPSTAAVSAATVNHVAAQSTANSAVQPAAAGDRDKKRACFNRFHFTYDTIRQTCVQNVTEVTTARNQKRHK